MYVTYEIGFLIVFALCVFVDRKVNQIRKNHGVVINWLYQMQIHEQPLTQEEREQLKYTYLDCNGICTDVLYKILAKSMDPTLKRKSEIEAQGKMYLDKIMGEKTEDNI